MLSIALYAMLMSHATLSLLPRRAADTAIITPLLPCRFRHADITGALILDAMHPMPLMMPATRRHFAADADADTMPRFFFFFRLRTDTPPPFAIFR